MNRRPAPRRAQKRNRTVPVLGGILAACLPLSSLAVPALGDVFPTGVTQGVQTPVLRVAAGGNSPKQVGLAVDGTTMLYSSDSDRARNLDRIAASGAEWLRVDVAATQVTWAPGRYYWSALDEVVGAADARGIKILGALSGVPAYARPEGTGANWGPQTQAEVDAFATFARAAAERYAGRVGAWEIWGEANRADTWAPTPSAEHYTRTLKAVNAAIDSVDPSSTVVLGGAGGATDSQDVDGLTWLKQVYAAGGKDAFEAIGAHAWLNESGVGAINLSDDYQRASAAAGDSKPLWWTMVGIASGGTGMPSEQTAADSVTAITKQTTGSAFGPTFFYTLNDMPQDTPGARMGFFHADGSSKLTWAALQEAAGASPSPAPAPAPAPTLAPSPTQAPSPTETPSPTTVPVPAPMVSPAPSAGITAMASGTGVAVSGTSLLYASPQQRELDLDRIAASGGTWLRLDFAASQITWAGPSQYDWSRMDAVIDGAARRNLKVLGVLSGLPAYARPASSPITHGPSNDTERAAFADFAQAAASRYKGRVDNWEVWNEPNLRQYWTPTPSAGAYMSLMSTTRNRIKGINPSAVVVSAGTGGAGGSSSDVDAFTWLDQLYANGLKANSDAVGVHLYTHPFNKNLGEFLRLDAYRAVLDRNGDATKELWATEAGGSNGGASPIDEAMGADFLEQELVRWNAMHHHGPLMFYTLYDEGGSDFMGYLGLLHEDGSPKQVYARLQELTRG